MVYFHPRKYVMGDETRINRKIRRTWQLAFLKHFVVICYIATSAKNFYVCVNIYDLPNDDYNNIIKICMLRLHSVYFCLYEYV